MARLVNVRENSRKRASSSILDIQWIENFVPWTIRLKEIVGINLLELQIQNALYNTI